MRSILRNVGSEEEFSSNSQVYYSTLHLLQLSIQCLIDMASRLISQLGGRKPKEYSGLADILYEEKVLDEASKKLFGDMIRFRNLLIHVYAKLSPNTVYRIAKDSSQRDIRNVASKIIEAATTKGYDPQDRFLYRQRSCAEKEVP